MTESPKAWLLLLLCSLTGGFFATGCAARKEFRTAQEFPTAQLSRFEFTRPQMGVPFRIVLYAPTSEQAAAGAEAAFSRIAQLNQIFSDYDPDSEANRLCHETPPGQTAPVSAEMAFVLERSQALARDTDGAFDVTVGPLVNLWRRARRHRELPPEDLLNEARPRVGWTKLHVDARRRLVRFGVKDMRLDFGGIAKGYAADEALRVLKERGLSRALIAAAGDVAAGDPPPDEAGWNVQIGGAEITNAPPPRTVLLRNAAVATSGDIFQRLEIGGKRYSHILDPRTGIGLADHALVTVLAPDGITADSLATAVSVLGPRKGLRLIERTDGAAAWVLRAPEGVLESYESRRLARWPIPPSGNQ